MKNKNKKIIAPLLATVLSLGLVGQALATPLFISSEAPTLFTNCAVLGTCVVYVDASYAFTDANGSKEKPFSKISDAVAKVNASSSYNAIFVAEGTYATEALPLSFNNHYVEVRGGYFASFASHDPLNHPSVIQASADPVIFSYTNSGGVIDGFHFTGAGAPGFLGSGYTVKVENTGSTKYTVLIQNNEFDHNNAGFGVSGVSAKALGSNKIYISNNRFHDNVALGSIVNAEGNTVVAKNYFFQNTSSLGVVSCKDGSVVADNFLVNNTGSYLVFANGSCLVTQNTLANNEMVAGSGYAAIFMTSNDNVVTNNLIAQTKGNQTFAHDAGDNSVPENNGFFQNANDPVVANGNFTCDPKFSTANPNDVGSYKLGAGSDCVDHGKAQTDPQTDFFGNARNVDGNNDGTVKADVGAYETGKIETAAEPKITDALLSPATISSDQKSIDFHFSTNVDGKISVQILKGAIEMNRLMDAETKSAGTQPVLTLDGKDKNGDMLADGDYTLRVTLQTAQGVDSQDFNFTVNSKIATTPTVPPVVIPAATTCEGFTDVLATDTHCEAIKYVKAKGIFKGYADGSFKPEAVINRAETIKVVLLGLGKTIEKNNGMNLGFQDADPKQWYMDFIQTAKDLAVIKGYKDGTVRPGQQVIRSEMLKIFFATTGKDYSKVVVTKAPYADVPLDASTAWYVQYAQLAKNYSLVDADAKGNFSPDLGMKRVDVAELFYRYSKAGV